MILERGLNIWRPARFILFLFFYKNSMLFLGNGLKIGWPFYFKIFRKTHVFFFKKMVSISGDLPVLNFKINHLTSRSKQCRFTIPILFHSSVDLRFCTSAVPKNLETILAFITHFPARLVLWQYIMHVFVTYFWKHRSPLSVVDFFELLFLFVCSTYPLELKYAQRVIFPILFMLDEEISSSLWGPFLLHCTLLCIILLPMF